MTRRVQQQERAAGSVPVNELAHILPGDDVLLALQDQRRDLQLAEIRTIVGGEGDASELLRDLGSVRQKLLVSS